jgi:hypothetical protein
VIERKVVLTYADLHCRIGNVKVTRMDENLPHTDGAYHNASECVVRNHRMYCSL